MKILVETIKWTDENVGFRTDRIKDTELALQLSGDMLSIYINDMQYKIPIEVIYGILYKENLIGR